MDERVRERILCEQLHSKVCTFTEASSLIRSGQTIGCSGFVAVGHPKAVLREAARQGSFHNIRLLSGGGTGDETVGELARAHALSFLSPYNNNPDARRLINRGEIEYVDLHLSEMPAAVRAGFFGKIDLAVIECCMIEEDGGVVPTLSIGASEAFIACAERVILEVNLACPTALRGLHQCTGGRESIPCPPEKVAAIVFTDEMGKLADEPTVTETDRAIAANVVSVIRRELDAGRLPRPLTVEPGIGAVAVAVFTQMRQDLAGEPMRYVGVVQDAAVELMIDGVLTSATGAALRLSPRGYALLLNNLDKIKGKLHLLPQNVSNDAGNLTAQHMAAVNTAIEADLWGNVNSTHMLGAKIMNGMGGASDFSRHSALSIFMTPSTAKGGAISCIVPQVSHVDQIPYDVDFLVTEQGAADLRCCPPRERAERVIEHCAHPDYRGALRAYLQNAEAKLPERYTAFDMETAHDWHRRFLQSGTMRPDESEA